MRGVVGWFGHPVLTSFGCSPPIGGAPSVSSSASYCMRLWRPRSVVFMRCFLTQLVACSVAFYLPYVRVMAGLSLLFHGVFGF